jgi:hypothetical protein
MTSDHIIYRVHALQRMFERGITTADVRSVVETGDCIEDYPGDFPFPSKLLLGWRQGRPLHVVVARDESQNRTIIVTVYEPDAGRWEPGYRMRKSR